MAKVTQTSARKSDHIRINLEEDVRSGLTTGLERYFFLHNALPEVNLEEIDLGVEIFGKKLKAPLLISSMTGGSREATELNQRLAEAAQATGIAMGLGSQRAAIEESDNRSGTSAISTFFALLIIPSIIKLSINNLLIYQILSAPLKSKLSKTLELFPLKH